MNIDSLIGRVCRVGLHHPAEEPTNTAWAGEGVCIGGMVILDQLYILIEFETSTEWTDMASISKYLFKDVSWMPRE